MPQVSHTYMRGAVPAKNNGQCPCCLRHVRSTKKGTMIRHGWKESGRQVGQLGCGFQWGNCLGWGKRPLEQTDADALGILHDLEEHLVVVNAQHAHHRDTGEESYGYSHSEQVRSYEAEKLEQAKVEELLLAAFPGLKVTTGRERRKAHRVYYVEVKTFSMVVTRGSEEFKITSADMRGDTRPGFARMGDGYARARVPSYEELRATEVRELADLVRRLTAQVNAIKTAIKHHLENPSDGSRDTQKRGPVTHWLRRWEVKDHRKSPPVMVERTAVACGSRGYRVVKSEKTEEVTCSRCSKHLPKKEAS